MPNLSIKDVPEALAEKLRQRAVRNHRSLQGELMAMLEAATDEGAPRSARTPVAEPTLATASATLIVSDPVEAPETDGLLAELDAIVADSRWGSGPLLTREQTHDRRLMRELEFIQRQQEDAPH
jgi:plasmid stability protein